MSTNEIDGRGELMNADFTVEGYRKIVIAAARRYRFVRVGQTLPEGDVALWRHDIDFSPESSLKLARIEAELGLVATYYVQLSSRYYNIFEPEIAEMLRVIASLGHDIGLHFDPEVCRYQTSPDYESRLAFEANTLGTLIGAKVTSFTLHNPTTLVGVAFDEDVYCGLINGSAVKLRQQFEYCSDSNGMWRYRNLAQMIDDPSISRLYALTHPEWWQPTAMPPREQLERSIVERAEFCRRYYDGLLEENSRPNIGRSNEK